MQATDLTDAMMPFGEHLDELRRRLIYALVGIVPIFIISLFFGEPLLAFMIHPLQHALRAAGMPEKLIAIGLMETFNNYLKVSFIMTIVVGAPWIVYQLWRFVSPGLHAHERRFAYILAPLSVSMTILGAAFMYWVMLPIMLLFFVTFGTDLAPRDNTVKDLPPGVSLPSVPILDADPPHPTPGQFWINQRLKTLRFAIPSAPPAPPPAPAAAPDAEPQILEIPLAFNALVQPMFAISQYVSFVLGTTLAFTIAFQMPVAVLLLGWIGIVDPKFLGKYRRHSIFACAVIGAVVTPTGDPISMMLLAVPLYALYEFGVLLLKLLPVSRVVGKGAQGQSRGRAASTSSNSSTSPSSPQTQPSASTSDHHPAHAHACEANTDDEET